MSGRRRRTVLLAAAVASATGFAVLALLVHHHRTDAFDAAIAQSIVPTDHATRVLQLLTWAGSTWLLLPGTVLACIVAWPRRRAMVWPLMLAETGALAAQNLFKVLVDRDRPPAGIAAHLGPSFPSGHTTSATAVWLTLAYVMLRERLVPPIALAGAASIAIIVGVSRVYLGVHWGTDVLAGHLLGVTIAAGAFAAYEHVRQCGPMAD